MKKLYGVTMETKGVPEVCKEDMFKLLSRFYGNVTRKRFLQDLNNKSHVILLCESDTKILRGFSTVAVSDSVVESQLIRIVFSGDTIIHPEFWGCQELSRHFCRYLEQVMEESVTTNCYWLLISKGYKTYRYLPVFFNTFYPCYECVTPRFEQKLIDALAHDKFGSHYNVRKGIVCFDGTREYLKKGIADLCQLRLNNPHVQFFLEKNPNYAQGDELLCIAQLTHENLKKSFFKFIQ